MIIRASSSFEKEGRRVSVGGQVLLLIESAG